MTRQLGVAHLLREMRASTKGACDRTADSGAAPKRREAIMCLLERCWVGGGCEYKNRLIYSFPRMLHSFSFYFSYTQLLESWKTQSPRKDKLQRVGRMYTTGFSIFQEKLN